MMTHFITIDELEREISYLREQNQKLIRELSQVVEENSDLREERATERQRLQAILERGEREHSQNRSGWPEQHGDEDDQLCLN